MPVITITNNSSTELVVNDPLDTSFFIKAGPLAVGSEAATDAQYLRMRPILADLEELRLDDGTPLATVDVVTDDVEGGFTMDRWVGNHIGYGVVPATATAGASTNAVLRLDHTIGEGYVDGVFYAIAAATDTSGDAQMA